MAEPIQPNSNDTSAQQTKRSSLLVLLLLTILIIAFAVISTRSKIIGPANQIIKENKTRLAQNQTESLDNLQADLTLLDTDNDTINDYQELNVFNTSPYLADTDSDGIRDDVEIRNGTDPTCAKGDKHCESSDLGLGGIDAVPLVDENFTELPDIENLSAADLRQVLIEQGIDANLVEQISDKELVGLYQSLLQQVMDPSSTSNNVTQSRVDADYQAKLDKAMAGELELDELRALMLEGGFDPDALANIPDNELQALYDQTVTKVQQGDGAEEVDINNLRDILSASGVESKVLDELSDQELLDLYIQTLNNIQ